MSTIAPRRRVLIVDDEERVTRVLEALLRNEYDVEVSNDPQHALNSVERTFFHVIVSDQRMPQMEGVEFLRRSREISAASVRILLTGYSDMNAIVGSLNEGEIFRFMSKPWRTSEIREIIREAAEISAQTQRAVHGARAAAVKTLEPAGAYHALGGVLVLDSDAETYRLIQSQGPEEFTVHHATTITQALDILAAHRIAIIVSDMLVGGEDTARLLRMLKVEYPHILVILMSSTLDSEGAIRLINYIQVFRFVPKPVRSGLLRQNIRSAYSRYREFSLAPELTRRHTVANLSEVATAADNRGLWIRIRQFVGTLRLLSDRPQE